MRIRHMRVGVPQRRVPVPMAVRAARGQRLRAFVCVGVVPVVVMVRVLVLQCLVFVFMAVVFDQVHQHAGKHQQRSQAQQPTG